MHEYFYHPSNMSLFFYGNRDITQGLKYLSDTYLNHYKKTHLYNHSQIINPLPPKDNFQIIHSKNA